MVFKGRGGDRVIAHCKEIWTGQALWRGRNHVTGGDDIKALRMERARQSGGRERNSDAAGKLVELDGIQRNAGILEPEHWKRPLHTGNTARLF